MCFQCAHVASSCVSLHVLQRLNARFTSTPAPTRLDPSQRRSKGNALLFWSLKPDSRSKDMASMHGGCPVLKGDKWSATKCVGLALPAAGCTGCVHV
jgi:hypothetical protein